MMPFVAIVCTMAVACGPVAGGGGAGAPARIDHSADRVVISRFTHITGVALTNRFAFVSSESGVATFDRLLQSWMPPVSEPEPGPPRRVLGIAAHPLDDAVWIIEPGGLVRFEPTLGWSMRTTIVGTIDGILFDRRDPRGGIFVRSFGRWLRVSATGLATPIAPTELPPPDDRLTPTTIEELARRRPALGGYARLLTRDARMRSWEPSAADEAPDGSEIWLGTWGHGVFRVDPEFLRSVHEPYGLLERGAGALALATDGVWIAGTGDPRASATGLVFASTDLRDWAWQTPGVASGLDGAMPHAIALRGRRAWVATDRGAVRLELDGAPLPRALTSAGGLPSDDVLSMLPRLDGLWIATSRGLVFVRERWEDAPLPGAPEIVGAPVLSGTPVRGLVGVGDTLWIASDAGLLLLAPGEGRGPSRPASSVGEPRLGRPMLAIAASDSVVAVATESEVLLLNARTGVIIRTPAAANARAVGRPRTLEIDAHSLWLGGDRGVLVVDRVSGASRTLSVPGNLPGRVRDIALGELVAWIATDEGVVRLRRAGGGMPR